MMGGGYLARLARQSGVVVRGTPPAEGASAHSAPAPTGIEVVSERIVAPVPPSTASTARLRESAQPFVTDPRAAGVPVAPVPPPTAIEHRREPHEDLHPVVRVGEARLSPAMPVTDAPPARERVAAAPVTPLPPLQSAPPPRESVAAAPVAPPVAPLAPPRSAFAIDEEVFVMPGEQAPPIELRSADPPARFARALADARRWVSATPTPGEIAGAGTATVPAEETSASAPPVVVREQIVAAASAAPAMQEMRVSIGRIEVIIDDPPAPAPAMPARAAAPVASSNAPPAMRRLSRHYLRG